MGSDCTTNGAAICSKCDFGYFLNAGACQQLTAPCTGGNYESAAETATTDRQCLPKACTCANSPTTGATGADCPTNGAAKCASCTGNFWLNGDECQAWTTTCDATSEYESVTPSNVQDRECMKKTCGNTDGASTPHPCGAGFTTARAANTECTTCDDFECCYSDCTAFATPMMETSTDGAGTAKGTTFAFTCMTGYTPSGPATCGETGWDAQTCDPDSCANAFSPTNIVTASPANVPHGDTYPFSCTAGYQPSHDGVATCTLGSWSSAKCDPKPCSSNFDTTHIKMAVGKHTLDSNTVIFECNEGYMASGPAECSLGTWKDTATCEPASCDTAFTTPFILENVGAGTLHGNKTTFSCLEGYLPVNPDAECKMGKWDMKSVCEEDPNAKNKFGLSAGVIFVIVMLILGAALVPLLMLRNWHAKRNNADIENQSTYGKTSTLNRGTDGTTTGSSMEMA